MDDRSSERQTQSSGASGNGGGSASESGRAGRDGGGSAPESDRAGRDGGGSAPESDRAGRDGGGSAPESDRADDRATSGGDRRRRAFVVSHTHWDREWYLTFHQFRVHLVSTIRAVLDELDRSGAFRHFLLDGQTVALEDFLEIAPEEEERLRRHADAGGLSIGPWYILPDEFLVGAESTVRNLLLGHAVGRRVGPVQKVGYMPDSFGHIAQMPQILRGAGIDSFVYTRGNGDEIRELGSEYIWRAPDGSEVLAVNQCGGYANAAALGHAELWHAHTEREIDPSLAVDKVRSVFERSDASSNVRTRLLMNGSDHLPPQRDLGTILDALARAFPDTEFVHAGLGDYVRAVRGESPSLRSHEGELLGGAEYHILSGVWSARMPLKQANDRAETLLADVLEPLAAYARFMLGREYPHGFLDYAWRLLLRNHPHDSICGCSIDEVHTEMETRFAGVLETAERLTREILVEWAPMFAPSEKDDRDLAICVANTLPSRRAAVIDRTVIFVPPAPDVNDLVLLDEEGREVPFEVLDETYVERFWGIDYRTLTDPVRLRELFESYLESFGARMLRAKGDPGLTDCFLRVRFLADELPGVGHRVYRLVERSSIDPAGGVNGDAAGGSTKESAGRAAARSAEGLRADAPAGWTAEARGDLLENDVLKVRLHGDGTFDLTDKRSGREYRGLNVLEDSEDVGDEYDFSHCEEPLTITSEGVEGTTRVTDGGKLAATLEARFALVIPEAIARSRERRSNRIVECPATVRLTLTSGSPLLDVELLFDNRALDHRLRALFPTDVTTGTIISDGHFYLNERPLQRERHPDWVQPAPDTWPHREFSLVEDGRRGLAVLSRGLPEVAALRAPDGGTTIALTLLRSVGWLSRDDFPTRKCQNAGPTLATPDAQCPGPQRFSYAVLPYEGGHLDAGVKAVSRAWRVRTPSVQGVWNGHVAGGAGLLASESGVACVSAVKRHETRDTLVVRVYNLSGETVSETLRLGRPVRAAWRVDLLEERLSEIASDGCTMALELGPHEIATFEIELAP